MRTLFLLGSAIITVATISAAQADVPQMINYQGHLGDGSGSPLDTTGLCH